MLLGGPEVVNKGKDIMFCNPRNPTPFSMATLRAPSPRSWTPYLVDEMQHLHVGPLGVQQLEGDSVRLVLAGVGRRVLVTVEVTCGHRTVVLEL